MGCGADAAGGRDDFRGDAQRGRRPRLVPGTDTPAPAWFLTPKPLTLNPEP